MASYRQLPQAGAINPAEASPRTDTWNVHSPSHTPPFVPVSWSIDGEV